jgi:hypothetical protein
MSLTYLLSIAGGLLAVGTGVALVAPPIVAALGAIAALAGLAMFALWALGFMRQYLRFDPEGLTLGKPRYEFQVPWDSVVAIRTIEIHENPFVMLSVGELSALKVTPPSAARKVYKRVLREGIIIPPYHYGMESDPLLALLERYVRDPAARAELAPKPAAPVLLDAPKA